VDAPCRQKYRKASAMAEEEKIFSLKESNSCMFFRVVDRLLLSFNNNNLRYNSTYFRKLLLSGETDVDGFLFPRRLSLINTYSNP
jgi:hypothetical protein